MRTTGLGRWGVWALAQAILWGWLVCGPVVAARASIPQLTLGEPAAAPVPLGRLWEVLPDGVGRYSQPPRGAMGWQVTQGEAFQPGFSRSAYWLRLRLYNASAQTQQRVIDLGEAAVDYADVYLLRSDGSAAAQWQMGDLRPFSQRPLAVRSLAVPVTLAPDERLDLYVYQRSYDGWHEPMRPSLLTGAQFASRVQQETLLYSAYYGLMLAMMAYNFSIFLATRKRIYGFYTLYLSTFFFWNLSIKGYLAQYIWPNANFFNNQITVVATPMMAVTGFWFVRHYFNLEGHAPRLDGLLRRVLWLAYAAIALAMLGYYTAPVVLAMICASVVVPLFIVAGVMRLRAGDPAARYYLLAFVAIGVFAGIYLARVMGWLASDLWTENAMQIGSSLEALLLAFGLADKIKRAEAQKLAAERQARQLQTQVADRLEAQVRLRTRELSESNARLTEANTLLAALSTKDELTGLLNRRQFNAHLGEICAPDGPRACALALVDIDQFKRYNDRLGHAQGDLALLQVAQLLQDHAQAVGARAYRVGGEEFAVLLSGLPPDGASGVRALGETICQAIRELAIAHPASPMGLMTLSMGVAVVATPQKGLQARAFYQAADELLYAAKHAGRNRVMCACFPAQSVDA